MSYLVLLMVQAEACWKVTGSELVTLAQPARVIITTLAKA